MAAPTEAPVSTNPYAGLPNNGDVPAAEALSDIDKVLAQNDSASPAATPTPQSDAAFVSQRANLSPASPSLTPAGVLRDAATDGGFVSSKAQISAPSSASTDASTPRATPNTDFVSQKANLGPDTSNFTSPNSPSDVPSYAQQAVDAQPEAASTVAQAPVTPGFDANAKLDMASGTGTQDVGKPDPGLDKAIYDTAANVATSGRIDTTMGDQTSSATPEQVKALADSPKNLYQLAAQDQISQQTLDAAQMLRAQQWNTADLGQKALKILNTGVQLGGAAFNSLADTVGGEVNPLLQGGRGPLLQGGEEFAGSLADLAGRQLGLNPHGGTTNLTPGGFPKTWEQVGIPKDKNAPPGPSPTMGINPDITDTSAPRSEADQENEAAKQKDVRTLLSVGSNLATSVEHAGQAILQNTGDVADTASKLFGPNQSINKWLGMDSPDNNLINSYGLTLRGLPYEQMPIEQRQAYNLARTKQIQDDGTELAGNAQNVNHVMDFLAKTSGNYAMSPLELKAYGQPVDPTAIQAASLGAQILLTHKLPEIPGFGPLVDHLSEGAVNTLRVPVRAADLSFKLASAAAKNETALNVVGGLSAISTAWHALANGDFNPGTMASLMGELGGTALGSRFIAKSKGIGAFLDHVGSIAAKGDQFMATAADEASAGRPFFGEPTGDIGKWIPPWIRNTGEALMPSGSMELAGPATRLGAGLIGQTVRSGVSAGLMTPAFTQEPEDAAKMIGQMAGYGMIGAAPGAALEAFHAPFDHIFTPKYGSLIPGKYGDAAPFRGFGTNWDGGANAPFRPYGTDAEADRVDKATISMFPQDVQNRINNLRQMGNQKWQVHVFDDQSMDNVMQAHTNAEAARIDQQIVQAQQSHNDALIRSDPAAAQTHADTIQQLQSDKSQALQNGQQGMTGSSAKTSTRGFFFNNGPDGTGPMQAYVRHSSVDDALGHEGLGHPTWQIMQAMDAKNGTTYAPDFLNAAKRTTNMDTFANDYIKRMSGGGIRDATYNNLPTGISQTDIDNELAAEHGAGLLDGAPASLFTKNPTFQRSLTMGVGSVLEHVLGIPVTGLLSRHEIGGFNGSVASALQMDQAIRAMSTDPSTIRPWQAKLEKIAKSMQPVNPDEAAAQSLAKGGKFTLQQARDIIAQSKKQGSPSSNTPPVKYTPAQNARAILANPNAQGFTADEANRHVPDDATNIGDAVTNARKSILAERLANGIPSPDEERAVKQAAQDAADASGKAAKDKAAADAQIQANKAEVANNLANPEWVKGMEDKHGLKPGSMVAADNGAIHANRLDESHVTIQKGQPIQEGHVGNEPPTPKSDADKVLDDYERAKQGIENEFNKKGSIQKPDGSVVEANEHLDDELSPDEPAPGSSNKPMFMPAEGRPEDRHEGVIGGGTGGIGKKPAGTIEPNQFGRGFSLHTKGDGNYTTFDTRENAEKAWETLKSQKNTEAKSGPSAPKVEPPQAPNVEAQAVQPAKPAAASSEPPRASQPTGTVARRPDGTWSLHVGSDENGLTPHVRRFASEQGAKNAAATLRSKYGNALMDEGTSAKVWGKETPKSAAPEPPKTAAPPQAPKAEAPKDEGVKGAQGSFPEPPVSPGPGTEITSKGVIQHQPRKKKVGPPIANQNLPSAPGPVPGAPGPSPPVTAAPGVLTPIPTEAPAAQQETKKEAPKETTEHTVHHQKALIEEGHSPGKAQKIVTGETPKIEPRPALHGGRNIGAYGYAGDSSWDHASLRGVGAFPHVSQAGSLIPGYSAGLTLEGAARRGVKPGGEFVAEDGKTYRYDDTAPSYVNGHPVADDYVDVYDPSHEDDHGFSPEQIAKNKAYMAQYALGSNGKRGPIIEGESPRPALSGESQQPASDIKPPANAAVPSPLPAPIDVSKPTEPLKNITSQTIEDAQQTAHQEVTSRPGTQVYDNAVNQHMLMNLGAQHTASLPAGDTRVTYDPASGYTTGTHFVTDGSDPFHDWLLKGQTPQVMETLSQIQSAIAGKRDLFFNYGSAVQKEPGLPTGGQRVASQTNAPAKAREQGLADIQSAGKNIMPTYVGATLGKDGKPNSVIYGGISPDKVAGNAATITHALGPKSPYPTAPLGDNGVAEMDAKGFLSNHANGWDGTGQKKLVPAKGQEADVSQESPGFEPYNMSQAKSDFWNLAVQGKDAQMGRGKRAAAAFEMSRLNSGYTSQGYTNKLAHQLDMAEGPQPKMVVNPEDPDGPNIQAKDKNGKPIFENWTENKLHSGYEMLKASLTGKIHASGERADEPIHPGHPALTQAMQEKGLPNTRAIKAGFMPQEFVPSSPEDFIKARDKTTRVGYLSPLAPEDIKEHKLYVNPEGTVGAAVDPKGDVQNVFNNGGPKGAGADAVAHAISQGGNTLDAFDDYLPKLYRQFGFQETGRMKFNPDYAPEGWNYVKDDNPDVVFMAHKGYPPGGPEAAVARAKGDKGDWIKNEQTDKYEDDYDAAKRSSRRAVYRGGAEVPGGHGAVAGETSNAPAETPFISSGAGNRGPATEGRAVTIGNDQAEAGEAGQRGPESAQADAERLGAYRQALRDTQGASDRIDKAFRQGGKPRSIDVAAEESAKQLPLLRDLAKSRGELLPPMETEPDAGGSEHHVWFSDDGKTATKETYYKDDPFHGERKRFGAVPTLDGVEVRDATPQEYLDRIGINNDMGRKIRLLGLVDQGNGETRIRTEEPTVSDAVDHPSMDEIGAYMNRRGFYPQPGTPEGGHSPAWFNPESKTLASDAQPRNFLKTPTDLVPVDLMLRHADAVSLPLSDQDRLAKNEQQRSQLAKQQAKLDITKPEDDQKWDLMASKIHDLEREHQRLTESVKVGPDEENVPQRTKAAFMPGDVVEGPGGEKDRIASAAVRYRGKIFQGFSHYEAMEKLFLAHRNLNEVTWKPREEDQGYVTESGKYVPGDKGWKIAEGANQIAEGETEGRRLKSEQIEDMSGYAEILPKTPGPSPGTGPEASDSKLGSAAFMPGDIAPERRERIIDEAVQNHGITTNPLESGYLLPNGQFLNMSGGKSGDRGIEHDAINIHTDRGENPIDLMLKSGAVRISGWNGEKASGGGETEVGTVPLTKAQRDVMLDHFGTHGEGYVSVVDNNGRALQDKDYPAGTSKTQIVGDVMRSQMGQNMRSGKAAFMPMAGPRGEGFEQAEREGRTFTNPYDKLPRYEISDHDMEWKNPRPLPEKRWGLTGNGVKTGWVQDPGKGGPDMDPDDAYRLGDLINHPSLFKDYPDAKKINVIYNPRMGDSASFEARDPQDKRATGLIQTGDPSRKDLLVHEIQHWIQEKEGFPGTGTSVSNAIERISLPDVRSKASDEFSNKFGDPTTEDLRDKIKAEDPNISDSDLDKDVTRLMVQHERARSDYVKKKIGLAAFDEYQSNAGEIESREAAKRSTMTPEERQTNAPYNPEGGGYIAPNKAHFLPPAKAPSDIRAEYAETPERNVMVANIQKKAQDWLDKNEAHPLSSHVAASKIPEGSDMSVEEFADHLMKGSKNLDFSKPSIRTEMSKAVTHDIMKRLAEKGSGVGWYDVIPDAAIKYLSDHLDPSIMANPDNTFMYKVSLAIASQGQSVYDNAETAYHAYKHWQDTGKLPTERQDIVGGGKNWDQIAGNFDQVNDFVKTLGIQGTQQLFDTKMSVKDMKEKGLKIGREDPNHSMQASLVLGPKIGAFQASLNKHFENLVMDLWFNRSMNRMGGNMFKFEESPFRKQMGIAKAQLESGEIKVPDDQRSQMLSEIANVEGAKKLTRANLDKMAPTLLDWANNQHKIYAKSPSPLLPDGSVDKNASKTYGDKTAVNRNAKNLDIGLHKTQDLPRDIPERKHFRDIINKSIAQIKDETGVDLTVADAQAILWYSEQHLFKKGGALSKKSDTSDYLDASYALAKQQAEHPGRPDPEARKNEKAAVQAAKAAAKSEAREAKKAAAQKSKLGPPVPSMAG